MSQVDLDMNRKTDADYIKKIQLKEFNLLYIYLVKKTLDV